MLPPLTPPVLAVVDMIQQKMILITLDRLNGSRKDAAIELGISPRTLRYKLAKMKDLGMAIPS